MLPTGSAIREKKTDIEHRLRQMRRCLQSARLNLASLLLIAALAAAKLKHPKIREAGRERQQNNQNDQRPRSCHPKCPELMNAATIVAMIATTPITNIRVLICFSFAFLN